MKNRKGITRLGLIVATAIILLMIWIFASGCALGLRNQFDQMTGGIVIAKIYEEAETKVVLLPNDDPFLRENIVTIVYDDEDYKIQLHQDSPKLGTVVKVTKEYYDAKEVGDYVTIKEVLPHVLPDDF